MVFHSVVLQNDLMYHNCTYAKLFTKKLAFVIVKKLKHQKAAVRSKCCRLVLIFRKKIVIIDDESYFYLSNTNISGNAEFYSSDINAASNDVRLKRKDKFEPKKKAKITCLDCILYKGILSAVYCSVRPSSQ